MKEGITPLGQFLLCIHKHGVMLSRASDLICMMFAHMQCVTRE